MSEENRTFGQADNGAGAELGSGHLLWADFLNFDRKRHCGIPDMSDAGDREVFEAFIAGAEIYRKSNLVLIEALRNARKTLVVRRDSFQRERDFATEAIDAVLANVPEAGN